MPKKGPSCGPITVYITVYIPVHVFASLLIYYISITGLDLTTTSGSSCPTSSSNFRMHLCQAQILYERALAGRKAGAGFGGRMTQNGQQWPIVAEAGTHLQLNSGIK